MGKSPYRYTICPGKHDADVDPIILAPEPSRDVLSENTLVAEQLGTKQQLKMNVRANTGGSRPSNLKPNGPDYRVLRTVQRALKRSARQP